MKKQYMKPEAVTITAEASAILSDSITLERGNPQKDPEWPDTPDEDNRLWAE